MSPSSSFSTGSKAVALQETPSTAQPSAQSRSTSAGSGAGSDRDHLASQLPLWLLEDLGCLSSASAGTEAVQLAALQAETYSHAKGLSPYAAVFQPADGSEAWHAAELQAGDDELAKIGLPPGLEHVVSQPPVSAKLAALRLSGEASLAELGQGQQLQAADTWMSQLAEANSEWTGMSGWDAYQYQEDWTTYASSTELLGMPPIEWELPDWTAFNSPEQVATSQVSSTSPQVLSTLPKPLLTTNETVPEWLEFPSVPEQPIGMNMEQVASIGSEGHFRGQCNPCAFAHTKGCSNGVLCEFCHLCDAGAKKRRARERRASQRTARIGAKAGEFEAADVLMQAVEASRSL